MLFLGSSANATFSHQRYDLENFTCCGTGSVRGQEDQRFGVRTSIKTPVIALGGTTVTYGFDFLRNTAFEPQIDRATGQIERTFQPDVAQNTYAGFAQVEVPVGDFLFNGGVRHEEIRQRVGSALNVCGAPLQGAMSPTRTSRCSISAWCISSTIIPTSAAAPAFWCSCSPAGYALCVIIAHGS